VPAPARRRLVTGVHLGALLDRLACHDHSF
jgi:hypothetical protein